MYVLRVLTEIGNSSEYQQLNNAIKTLFMSFANNRGADKTVHMHQLVCDFAIHIQQKQVLSHLGFNFPFSNLRICP